MNHLFHICHIYIERLISMSSIGIWPYCKLYINLNVLQELRNQLLLHNLHFFFILIYIKKIGFHEGHINKQCWQCSRYLLGVHVPSWPLHKHPATWIKMQSNLISLFMLKKWKKIRSNVFQAFNTDDYRLEDSLKLRFESYSHTNFLYWFYRNV